MIKGINLFQVSGVVVASIELKKSQAKRLFARTRIKLENDYLVDLYGFGDVAQQMNLICKLGYYIYAEAHLTNKKYVNKKGVAKAKLYFMVDNIKLVGIPKDAQIIAKDSLTEILDEIDPINYL